MTYKFPGFLVGAVAGIAALCVSVAPMSGQKNAFTASRGWYNQPDLQGIWVPAKPVDNLEKGGFIKDPASHKIPYKAGGDAKRKENEKNARTADLVGSSRVDLQACKLEYSIVSPK